MEDTPDGSAPSTDHFTASQLPSSHSAMDRQKRKRALSDVESPSSRINKAVQMKGCYKDKDPFDFHGSSDGEIEPHSRARGSVERPGKLKSRASKVEKGTNDMPPPHSHSVSNDQSRSPGLTLSTTTDSQSIRSLRSQDTPTMPELSEKKSTSMIQQGMSESTATASEKNGRTNMTKTEPASQDLCSSAIAALQTLPAPAPQEDPCSSASLTSPSQSITVKKVPARTPQSQHDDTEDELWHSPNLHTAGSIKPIVLLSQRLPEQECPHSLTGTAHSECQDHETAKEGFKDGAIDPDIGDELGSDDNAVGMLREQYRPRPSRSRANCDSEGLVTPIDFSKRPETVAKAPLKRRSKIKRSKTTAFQELRPSQEKEDEDPEPATRMFGSDISKPRLGGDVGDLEDKQIVERGVAIETGLIAQKPTKKRGRPKKVGVDKSNGKATEKVMVEPMHPDMNGHSCEKGGDAGIALDEEDDGLTLGHCGEEATAESVATDRSKVLESSTGNANIAKRSEDVTKPASSPNDIRIAPETPKKAATAPGKGSDVHSPISNPNVAYRVGLSKRARIEPLLRIVRK